MKRAISWGMFFLIMNWSFSGRATTNILMIDKKTFSNLPNTVVFCIINYHHLVQAASSHVMLMGSLFEIMKLELNWFLRNQFSMKHFISGNSFQTSFTVKYFALFGTDVVYWLMKYLNISRECIIWCCEKSNISWRLFWGLRFKCSHILLMWTKCPLFFEFSFSRS